MFSMNTIILAVALLFYACTSKGITQIIINGIAEIIDLIARLIDAKVHPVERLYFLYYVFPQSPLRISERNKRPSYPVWWVDLLDAIVDARIAVNPTLPVAIIVCVLLQR